MRVDWIIFESLGKLRDIRAVPPLVKTLDRGVVFLGEGKSKIIDILINVASESEEQCRIVAKHLWKRAVSPVQALVYEPLLSIATRLVVLEVERLPPPEYPDV